MKLDSNNIFVKRGLIKNNLGITQGRLTEATTLQCFPDNDWEREFFTAEKLGYAYIECIRDKTFNEYNPLWNTNANMIRVKDLAAVTGTAIQSICDNYVMCCEWSKLAIQQYALLEDILIRSVDLNVGVVVFPLDEKSDICNPDSYSSFIPYIQRLGQTAKELGIRIALEISQNVDFLHCLFADICCDSVGLCVDTGNLYISKISAEDILKDSQLKEKIFHVHIKDRDIEGNNVIPGAGRVNFHSIIQVLYETGYQGMVVTETTRGKDPLQTAKYVKQYLEEIAISVKGSKEQL